MNKLLILCTLTLFVLLGCGEGKDPNEIIVWNQMRFEGRDILQRQLNAFMEKNPGITIRQTYYDTEELRTNFIFSALGESGPDMVFGPSDNVGPYAEIDLLHRLDEIFPQKFFEKYVRDAQVWRRVRGERHIYAIADRIGNHLVLCYNKAMVEKPPQTMNELIEMGKKLTRDLDGDGNTDQYALAWNYVEPYFMIPFLGSYGGWVFDQYEQPTLDTPAMRKAAGFILRLREEYKIVPSYCDYDIAISLFKQGRSAMIIDGPWAWAEYAKAGIDYGITRIPLNDATGIWPTPMVSPLGWSVSKNVLGERLEIVKKLLEFLLSEESQLEYTKILNTIPTHKNALEDPIFTENEIVQASLYAREAGRMMPTTPALRGIWNAMKPAYQGIINGSMSPAAASRKMQDDAERFIAEMYGDL